MIQKPSMKPIKKITLNTPYLVLRRLLIFSYAMTWLTSLLPYNALAAEQALTKDIYPEITEDMPTEKCIQCHPSIATLLRTKGAMHAHVECRQCHLQVHTYFTGKTNYDDILPKCVRCHAQPHGDELIHCSSCHQEAHAPLEIPASRALSQGCYACHPKLDKEIKIFPTKHTFLYCTSCHHTRHGRKPDCLECHQPHAGRIAASGLIIRSTNPLDQCISCHPPHKALKVSYPNNTENAVCSFCHSKVNEMLSRKVTKHTALLCVTCHPDKHKTIKRCKECHGEPHPEDMLKKFSSCGACHGIAHSVVR